MNFNVKQVSSLEKILPVGIDNVNSIKRKSLLAGQEFSYQIAIETAENTEFTVSVTSPLSEHIEVYSVRNTVMDMPTYDNTDDDYITKTPGIMPDVLMPMELEGNTVRYANEAGAVWVRVKVPQNTPAGEYPITICLSAVKDNEAIEIKQTMTLDVLGVNLPEQKTIFTQWFHVDCIADIHNVEIYSEEHWELIDKYMAMASDLGMTMILTPVITPPLDTQIGTTRPCTQLVKIEKKGDEYSFDFSLLKRWVDMCKKNGIKYFEISHLFSQWGLKCAPNIMIKENGEESYVFGWHVSAKSDEYKKFLHQFVPALISFAKDIGIKDKLWFHVSDEPVTEHLEAYKYAHDLLIPLLEGCPVFDALSHYEFYEKGLVQIPVTATDHIEPFLVNKVENQWAYYCCCQTNLVGNRFLAMPSYRNRILGLQLYKYNIQGFLQWGYNFYYSQLSKKVINPYINTSAERAFPSGDAFSVYPINNGVVPSLRAIIFKEALEDVQICRMLEGFIGREKVIEMIDDAAGMNVTFSEYPRNSEFIPGLMDKMVEIIKVKTSK